MREEIQKYQQAAQLLQDCLELEYPPMAIKLAENEKEIPENAVRPMRDLGVHDESRIYTGSGAGIWKASANPGDGGSGKIYDRGCGTYRSGLCRFLRLGYRTDDA